MLVGTVSAEPVRRRMPSGDEVVPHGPLAVRDGIMPTMEHPNAAAYREPPTPSAHVTRRPSLD